MNIKLENGKYELIVNNNGTMKCLRHGEEWRDLTGDGMVLAMAYEIERLRDACYMAKMFSEHENPIEAYKVLEEVLNNA